MTDTRWTAPETGLPGSIAFSEATANLAAWGERWRNNSDAIDEIYRSRPMTVRRRLRAATANILNRVDNLCRAWI